MSSYEWIVCERRGQWAAALRMAVARHVLNAVQTPRIYEVRRLEQLTDRLTERPDSLALVELHQNNLAQVLGWSAGLPRLHRHARFVALMDRSLTTANDREDATSARQRSRLVDVLLEAGAVEIVFSPRQMPKILSIAYRHAELSGHRRARSDTKQTISDWAWSLVPWQME